MQRSVFSKPIAFVLWVAIAVILIFSEAHSARADDKCKGKNLSHADLAKCLAQSPQQTTVTIEGIANGGSDGTASTTNTATK